RPSRSPAPLPARAMSRSWCQTNKKYSSIISRPLRIRQGLTSVRSGGGRVRIKACLNGDRAPGEHHALPLTPDQFASDALACAREGVFAVHVHPRDADGAESLDARVVGDAVRALRAAVPTLAVGVSTGAWIQPDVAARVAAIGSWDPAALPDFASVNV